MCALKTTHRPGPDRTASYSDNFISASCVTQSSRPHSQNTIRAGSFSASRANSFVSSTTRSLTSRRSKRFRNWRSGAVFVFAFPVRYR
jgi:hypothetical protein